MHMWVAPVLLFSLLKAGLLSFRLELVFPFAEIAKFGMLP